MREWKQKNQLIQRTKLFLVALLFVSIEFFFLVEFVQPAHAAVDVFRSTTYELQAGEFTGTNYTLALNNNLSQDYFVMISGPASANAARAVNQDQVRVDADPHSNFAVSTAVDELRLFRENAATNWIGALTVVECLIDCGASGFELTEVLEVSMSAGSANTLQSQVETLSANHSASTVPFGGRFGGGMSSVGSDNNAYGTTLGVKITKSSTNQLTYERFGAETRAPAAATFTTYVVNFGSNWSVQNVNVTGISGGQGLDATGEYDTAAISSVLRDQTWVWGAGYSRNDGLNASAVSQVITLGDGVAQNPSESTVAVGSESAVLTPGRDFQVYVISNAELAVDHVFKTRGDQGAANGFQELNISVDATLSTEVYDNAATDVQSTEGYRAPLFYHTSSGSGQAYSRVGAWGMRLTSSTNLNYWRAYSGQNVTGWAQVLDFSGFTFSNVTTVQQAYRFRDDSTALNTSGGWLAAENTPVTDISKNQTVRLRVQVSNTGTTPEDAARNYQLQFSPKNGVSSCSVASSWAGISTSALDEFTMRTSASINPDGVLTTTPHLSNVGGFSYVNGQARDTADTTSNIGPMSSSSYTEIEYSIAPTDEAVVGGSYCFRLYDTASVSMLDTYDVYPELEIAKTDIIETGLGEAGTFNSAVDGGWTTINFIGSYTAPVVVGTTNSVSTNNGLVFEVDNVTSSSADMRVCRSQGATANGCGSHPSESVGYMVVDAAVASVTNGIEAGTFSVAGEFDTTQPITNYPTAFSTTPYLFANVNTVNSTEVPTEVLVRDVTTTSFTSGLCEHLQGNTDSCDVSHPSETVGWVAIEPGNEPFSEAFDSGVSSIGDSTWTPVSFSPAFSTTPVVIAESQTDNGGQDVTIDEADVITTTGGSIRYCEIDTVNFCDSHNTDDVAWFAIEPGQFQQVLRLDQDSFRFYENDNSTTPSVAINTENTSIADVDDTDVVRLRLALQNGEQSEIASGSLAIKLQYKEATTCEAPGVWSDLGAPGSGSIWRGFDNAVPSDGATLPSSLLDGGSNSLQSYEEQNNSAFSPNTIATSSRGEWDFVLQNNNAPAFTEYCFRVVTDAGDEIQYSHYPEILTSSGAVNLPPDTPTNLRQKKTTLDDIPTGDPTNENTVVFSADATDQNDVDLLELCVEVKELGTAFTDSEDACGTPEAYSADITTCDPTGNAFYEKYDALGAGTAIGDLYAAPKFPNSPDSTQTISGSLLESPINIDDNFGGRLSALICPPQDGNYTFWVTGDDGTELRLSTDTNPANATTIADIVGWTNVNEWTKYGSQQSSPVYLNAGQYYYIEANYKEGGGGDHVQVGWTLPDATLERPISNANYSLPSETSEVIFTPGTTPEVEVDISGLTNYSQYHWQVRSRDAKGVYSAWTSYGGNTEDEIDFYIDTVAPTVVVYDGSTDGIDIEYNNGALDEISANWENIEGTSPDTPSGLRLWLDGSDIDANGVDPADGAPVSLWRDKSGNTNDISGTGDAVFDDSLQAVAFSDDAQPFNDTYDRSGGSANSQTIFAVVTGNASISNHVWYETTTPRVAPAEDGLLGAGTTLTDNHPWSSHITGFSRFTLEYLSTGTSTAWLNGVQEYQFSETQNFADSQTLIIGDDTTGGNQLETGEFVHEILMYNQDLTATEREDIWRYLDCKWGVIDCSVTYDYSVGTSPGATDILGWTDSLGSSNITAGSLSLETSRAYYVNVRATDLAGNIAVSSSDGQLVAPTLSFSVAGSGVDFGEVNDSNNFTSTQTNQLTTSTNARNGYAIRARATGLLTDTSNGNTVPFYDGGSYLAPSEWIGAFSGYGYTSDDTLVSGVNKFNPITCDGGGAGPCYAPFTTSAPGDIVADNPGPVSGTAINNEQFTITHRVTTGTGQTAGNYQTTIIYSATAVY